MALNLKLDQGSKFNFTTKNLGKLLCQNFTYGAFKKTKNWLENVENHSSEEFTKYLSTLICQTIDSKDPNEKINESQANTLTKDEINEFAELFVENNKSLLGTQKLVKEKDGEKTFVSSKTKILDELLKQDSESNTDHLLRVIERDIKERFKREQKIVDKFQNIGNFASLQNNLFSKSTLNLIKKNKEISDRLGSAIKQKPFIEPDFNIQPIKPIKNPVLKTNEILSSFEKELKNTASLIKNMNDLGVQMAKDFATSISTTKSWNKKMLWVGLSTLIATLIATFFTAYFSYQNLEYTQNSYKQANILVEQQNLLLKEQIKQQQQIIDKLKPSKKKIEKPKKN